MTQGLDIIYNIFIWVNPIYLPLIIFFLGFTSRECLFLNTVFLLIVSLYRFKVPTIFLHCDEKFFFLYWPDELSLRNFNKGSQPLCCLQVFFRFWGNVDILYHHNILIFWINPGQSKQILVHLLVSDVVSLEINKVIRHLSEHDFFQLDLPVKDGKLILLTQFFEPIIVFLDFSLRQKWCVVAVFIPVLLVQSDKLEFRLFFFAKMSASASVTDILFRSWPVCLNLDDSLLLWLQLFILTCLPHPFQIQDLHLTWAQVCHLWPWMLNLLYGFISEPLIRALQSKFQRGTWSVTHPRFLQLFQNIA